MCSKDPVVRNALAYVQNKFETRIGKPAVGDTVIYSGGPHAVVKDLGGGKYVLRSKTTGKSFGVETSKGLEIMEPGSFANMRKCANSLYDDPKKIADAKRALAAMAKHAADVTHKTTKYRYDPMSKSVGGVDILFDSKEEAQQFNPRTLTEKWARDPKFRPSWARGIEGFDAQANGKWLMFAIGPYLT